jgi:release factor glutamine methyltransferase
LKPSAFGWQVLADCKEPPRITRPDFEYRAVVTAAHFLNDGERHNKPVERPANRSRFRRALIVGWGAMRDDAAVYDASVVARLRAAGCVFAEDEAAVLLATARSTAELDALVERRAAGEPLEQVVGWAEFEGLRILVDPGVFVPRRRSEFLVSVAVGLGRSRMGDSGAVPVIVDLCCGTGALGLAVAAGLAAGGGPVSGERGRVELQAADLDPAAVACARRNVEPVGGHVYVGDLFAALPDRLRGRVDILICNAPYVPTGDVAFLPAEARDHEPLVALDGGLDGLAVLRRAAASAPSWLAPGAALLVETSDRQAAEMAGAMAAAGLRPVVHTDEDTGATVVTGRAANR